MAADAGGGEESEADVSDSKAGDGQIYVCAACGRTSKTRYGMGDSSCVLHAVLCYDNPSNGDNGKPIWMPVKEAP